MALYRLGLVLCQQKPTEKLLNMLNVLIDDRQLQLRVPDEVFDEGGDFFQRMDRDMDRGWQMGPEWVERPDQTQRCQIAADKLLTALENGNETLAMLMAGYILTRMPDTAMVHINTEGEPLETGFR